MVAKLARVLVGVLLVFGSLGAMRVAKAASAVETIEVNGIARTYRLYQPEGLSGPAPLVVMLHGGFGSGQQAEQSYGWDQMADTGHFMVAYPDGLNRAWNVGGGCCGQSATKGIDDVGFIVAMIEHIEGTHAVDPARIYATGISNGGMLAYALACQTNLFAAIGPDSATMLDACAHPQPVSVIHIHGLADTRIPFNGGQGNGAAKIDGPSVPALIDFWRSVDACGTPSSSTAGVVTTSIATCPQGRSVELISIAGAGHQWPGATKNPARQALLGTDAPSTALNATKTIWDFFAAHPKP